MTFLKKKQLHRCCVLFFTAFLFAALVTFLCLCAGAELSCGHDVGVKDGFCMENECVGYEIPALNRGAEDTAADDTYEVANLGQLYWINNVLLKEKDPSISVRIKLMGHIVINKALLDANGELNDAYFPAEGTQGASELYVWVPRNVSNVTFDGNGYSIRGLYVTADLAGVPVGIFGKAENVTVKNLGITESYFSAVDYAGAVIGEAADGCTVENCYVLKCAFGCEKAAGFVGLCGYKSAATVLKNLCTDAQGIAFECASETVMEKCFYLADEELDELEGTTAKGALLDAMSKLSEDNENPWAKSCIYNAPVLREEHYYLNACDMECSGKSCGNNACEDESCEHEVCTHTREVGEEGRVAHEYDNACDPYCNICGYLDSSNEQKHVYHNACQTKCEICGAERTVSTEHKYTSMCDKFCDYCGFERSDAQDHFYSYDCSEKCHNCGYKRTDFTPHTFDDKCDMVCNKCAITRPGDHAYDHACDVDCNDCGFVRAIEHAFGPFVVISAPTHFKEGSQERSCTVCGFQEVAVIAELPGLPLWLTLTWLISGSVVFLLSAFALYWFVIKKRTFAHMIGRAPEQLKKKEQKKREEERRLEKEQKKAEKEKKKPEEKKSQEKKSEEKKEDKK